MCFSVSSCHYHFTLRVIKNNKTSFFINYRLIIKSMRRHELDTLLTFNVCLFFIHKIGFIIVSILSCFCEQNCVGECQFTIQFCHTWGLYLKVCDFSQYFDLSIIIDNQKHNGLSMISCYFDLPSIIIKSLVKETRLH